MSKLPGFGARRRFWIGFAIAAISFASVALTIDGPGVAWDEPYCIAASDSYLRWLLAPSGWFDAHRIRSHWMINSEHPPLAKTAMGLVRVGVDVLAGPGRVVAASRLSTAIFFAALQLGLFLLVAGSLGEVAGIASCACLLLLPRVFGHAHLAVLDVPMACLWLWTTYAFVRGVHDRRWSVAAGVLFGLALLTKFDAVLLPVPLAAWGLVYHGRKAVRTLVAMALLGPVIFFAGWPWLWVQPWVGLAGYVADKLGRSGAAAWIVPSCYLGRVYADAYPPWHYAIVMTLITVPVGILCAVVAGLVAGLRGLRGSPPHGLLIVMTAWVLGVFSVPFVPRYDGVRLFLSVFPFVAALGGVGVAWALAKLPGRMGVALGVVFFASQAVGIVTMHPCELSSYSLLVGGPRGAQRLGMEPTYWGDSVTREAFGWLSAQATGPARQAVAFFPMSEFVAGPLADGEFAGGLYAMEGYIDLERFRIVRFQDRWDYAILFGRRSMIEGNRSARALWDRAAPAWRLRRMGVDLCRIYVRPGKE